EMGARSGRSLAAGGLVRRLAISRVPDPARNPNPSRRPRLDSLDLALGPEFERGALEPRARLADPVGASAIRFAQSARARALGRDPRSVPPPGARGGSGVFTGPRLGPGWADLAISRAFGADAVERRLLAGLFAPSRISRHLRLSQRIRESRRGGVSAVSLRVFRDADGLCR